MPGVKCTLSDDDDNHCNFTAGSMPKTYTFRDGILYEGIKLQFVTVCDLSLSKALMI